jgi:pimeloyl-ACP methyl ester carboxylesterase
MVPPADGIEKGRVPGVARGRGQHPRFSNEKHPVWLVGTSRGTISAATAAARLANIGPAAAGLVLTATLTDDPVPDKDVFDAPPHLIDVPVFIASHEDDACFVSPPDDIDDLVAAPAGAPKVKAEKLLKGGHGAISDACDALAPHGFFGVEAKVIKKIAKFINDNI